MGNKYELENVTKDNFGSKFFDLIRDYSEKFIQRYIPKTPLFKYLLHYLKFEDDGLQVKTIIRENKYTCLNFLEDYANYFARCYTSYEKHCKRIHFFKKEFTKTEFEQMLENPKHDNWDEYVGCMVIKPLPKGIFGITYLNSYTEDNKKKKRYYKCLSKKTINIFGHDCIIETMPFKEQDGVIASCATTALWMAFQKTSELFNTKAPSLSEITILAGDNYSNSGKIFPSKGLEINQVCKAIYNNGLMSEFRTDLTSKQYFNGLIYAYLKGDIPILLGLRLPTNDEYHLVTVNGYRLNSSAIGTKYFSDDIIRFYVHDDQIGPFSRLLIDDVFSEMTDDRGQRIKYNYSLTTSWWKKKEIHDWIKDDNDCMVSDSNTKSKDSYAQSTPAYVIIPISQKIKVTYEDIFEQQGIIDFVTRSFIEIENEVKWDIFVIKSNEYKKWLIDEFGQKAKTKIKDIITESLPQHIWIIQAWIEDELLFDFIYDTIELNKAGSPVAINIYNDAFMEVLQNRNMVDTKCSYGFSNEDYKYSLMRIINELPYDFEEIKIWLQYKDGIENWDKITKSKCSLEELWSLSEKIEPRQRFTDPLLKELKKRIKVSS